jgi:hypothetical protein
MSDSPVSKRLNERDVETESASSISVARTSRTAAGPRGPSAPLRPQVEQAPGVVLELREEKPAAVAEVRVVHVELVTVVPEGKRRGEVPGERLEAREVSLPLRRIELSQPHGLGCALVAKAQNVPRKSRRRDLVVELSAE